jgi:hypothetical protein
MLALMLDRHTHQTHLHLQLRIEICEVQYKSQHSLHFVTLHYIISTPIYTHLSNTPNTSNHAHT